MDTDNRGLVTYDVDIYSGDRYITSLEDFNSEDAAIRRASILYGGGVYRYEIFTATRVIEFKGEGTL